jgi:hypothetical protein
MQLYRQNVNRKIAKIEIARVETGRIGGNMPRGCGTQ